MKRGEDFSQMFIEALLLLKSILVFWCNTLGHSEPPMLPRSLYPSDAILSVSSDPRSTLAQWIQQWAQGAGLASSSQATKTNQTSKNSVMAFPALNVASSPGLPASSGGHVKWSGRPGIASHMTWRQAGRPGDEATELVFISDLQETTGEKVSLYYSLVSRAVN